jgi:Spx/MgsR family transcriptional regulator
MITVYGLPNCDSVKKARAWFKEHALEYVFHDFKKQGVPESQLDIWLKVVGWETLINRKGTMWRRLDDASQASVVDAASARVVALTQASVIKRPVVVWDDASVSVGFSPERFASHLP